MATDAEDVQQQMQARATERLLASGDWISAEEMARLFHRSSRNTQALLLGWVERGLIFSIENEGVSLYPAYALDAQSGTPLAELRAVLKVLQQAGRGGWAMAWWFDCPNSYLDGKRPKDLLAGPLDQVLQAAHAEAQGVQHG